MTNGEVEVLLKVDVKNAFNSLDRATLLTEVSTQLPEIYPYVWQCYSSASKLFFGDSDIKSSVGVQQGDPLGPALFSLGIHNHISNLTSKFNIWYLDDGTIGGNVDDVLKDLNHIKQQFGKIGLELNFSKCELFFTEKLSQDRIRLASDLFNEITPSIKILDKHSLCLLGAPLYNESIQPLLDQKIRTFSTNTDKLGALNSHIAFSILKYCLFVPKLIYILRASPIWKFPGLLDNMDATLKSTLEQILNLTFDEHSWNQATLPVKYGGIGVRKISSVALPAFLSSVHSIRELSSQILKSNSISLTYATEALESWKVRCPNVDIPKERSTQKLWDLPLVQLTHSNLLQNLTSDRDQARLLALSEKESGYWLHALPSKNLGTLLDNESFRVALGLRLGTPLCHQHRCPCGKEVDKFGIHGLSCQRSAGRLFRHGSLNDTIKRALATIDVPALIEPSGIRPIERTNIIYSTSKASKSKSASNGVPVRSRARVLSMIASRINWCYVMK
ncbi:uncharacterized protein LOC123880480 [Maniola jurtina]|uniref:uncharacterized protein LOC123880480 n=1 Tax=Maniola jurtina TaxID=191418 RepID=UPI001E688C11|nr:uncharacterized protein LOC123880480 [Maniola jurtina]